LASKNRLKRRAERWKKKMLENMPPEVGEIYLYDDYGLKKLGIKDIGYE
jgi:hypothetical protein